MGNKLHNLARVLEVATTLHDEGKIDEDALIKLVDAADTSLNDSERFLKELSAWALELLQLDDAGNQKETLKTVFTSFLQSPDADDYKVRVDAMELMLKFKALLVSIDSYNQEQLAYKLLNSK